MLDFQPMGLADIPRLRPYLHASGYRTCDYTVGGMLMWRDHFRMECAEEGGVMYTRLYDEGGRVFYNIPLGAPLAVTLPRLLSLRGEEPLRFCTLPLAAVDALRGEGLTLAVTPRREFFDYLYRAEALAAFAGRAYAGQRNLCRQFERENPVWECRPLGGDTLGDLRAMLDATAARADGYGREEARKVREVIENFDLYGFFGMALYTPEGLCGFSVGERVGDTLFVHIERAERGRKGAYQMLAREFSARARDAGAVYINREEDMGSEGLRTAKLALHPECLLEKYEVEVTA